MQFLKILFGIALGFVLGLWAWINWQTVTIQLWGGLAADVNLPFLILIVFLIGFLPTFLLYRARIWSRTDTSMAEKSGTVTGCSPRPCGGFSNDALPEGAGAACGLAGAVPSLP